MNDTPFVSVVIAFLNAERFLPDAIESVFAQSYTRWELMLVDDGSSDAGTELARESVRRDPRRVKLLEHPGHVNRGCSASRNVGIRHSRGELVAFLDADDVWLPTKLMAQVGIFCDHPRVMFAYGRTLYWHSWSGRTEDREQDQVPDVGVATDTIHEPPSLFSRYLQRKIITPCPCSVMVRRELLARAGSFEDSFRGVYEDQVFYSKVAMVAPIFVSSLTLEKYRQHPHSMYAVVKREGRREQERRAYLRWLHRFASNHVPRDSEMWRAVETEMEPFRHSSVRRLARWWERWRSPSIPA